MILDVNVEIRGLAKMFIMQDDLLKTKQQVTLMVWIYAIAQAVDAWLGKRARKTTSI